MMVLLLLLVVVVVVVVVVAATKDQKNLKVWLVACGFLAVWALTAASLVIVANLVCHVHFSVIT